MTDKGMPKTDGGVFTFWGIKTVEEKGPEVKPKIWDDGKSKAIHALETSIHRWNNRDKYEEKESLKARCWAPKDYKKGEYIIKLKVGTQKVFIHRLGDEKKWHKKDFIVEEGKHPGAMKKNLEGLLDVIKKLEKGSNVFADYLYEASKASKKNKGFNEGEPVLVNEGRKDERWERLVVNEETDKWEWVETEKPTDAKELKEAKKRHAAKIKVS